MPKARKILSVFLLILIAAGSFIGCSVKNDKSFQISEDFEKAKIGVLTGSAHEETAEQLPIPSDFAQLSSGRDDRRINLLTALKPYLSSSRSANVDKAIRLLRLTKLTETFRNEGK